ncbi:DUF3027 domain-containing protein [Arthrobacter sp. Soil764]|uniref:DUF3027 domain-containing protein n=1 Tax=Arthrobacter sp. Soil764 TaxID=1736403 RepID=UPI0007002E83|nr:DUF3027 domain-containing protein [Arthrobacter sp. Soil764]KRE90633.1 hypothetical protein ASG86_16960 [Arthrobacter sp. Soil764]
MDPQSEQPGTPVQEQAAKTPPKRKAGVPVWRTGKPDAFLAAAVDTARTAVEGITPAGTIGAHLAAKSEGDRLVTHLFESRLPGYMGWQWYAVLTRNSRSKAVTVNELGLLPSEESILAPEWVPWAERVRPEDEQQQEPEQQEPGQGTPEELPAGQGEPGGQEPDDDGGEPGDVAEPGDEAKTS